MGGGPHQLESKAVTLRHGGCDHSVPVSSGLYDLLPSDPASCVGEPVRHLVEALDNMLVMFALTMMDMEMEKLQNL